MTSELDKYGFAEAYDCLYHLVWDDFADWYLEASKGKPSKAFLAYCLEVILKLAHPFAPFLTETIWQTLAWEKDTILATAAWPKVAEADMKKAVEFEAAKQLVSEVRTLNASLKRPIKQAFVESKHLKSEQTTLIAKLAKLEIHKAAKDQDGLQIVRAGVTLWLDIDKGALAELGESLEQKIDSLENEVANLKKRLGNKAYVDNAPEAVVAETKTQLETAQNRLDATKAELLRLNEN